MFKKFCRILLVSIFLSCSLSQAQEVPLKDPRAVCQEIRKLIEVWKKSTKKAQQEHEALLYNMDGPPLTVGRKSASHHFTSITQSFTRKLINDHFGLCAELGFDDEITQIPFIPL